MSTFPQNNYGQGETIAKIRSLQQALGKEALPADVYQYGPPHGIAQLQAAMARHFEAYFAKRPVDPERVCILGGTYQIASILKTVCNPGEGAAPTLLLPLPIELSFCLPFEASWHWGLTIQATT